MTRVAVRLDRLVARRPALTPQPVRMRDLSRLTPQQLTDLERLNARYAQVEMTGLTDAEIEEIAVLMGILDEPPP